MSRLDDLQAEVEGNDLMNELVERVAQDRAKGRRMERCANCGINLAKIDPAAIIIEARVNPSGTGPEQTLTGRQWCSAQCRDWMLQRGARHE